MKPTPRDLTIIGGIALLVVLPAFGSDFFINFVMTKVMIFGLVASTVVFLSAYGGMVSLGQLAFFGVAGFMIGNAVAEAGSKGLKLGWNDWVAVVFALVVATAVAFIMGAVASRTVGIYFLMLTLTYSVIVASFFSQVTDLSGFGGITGIDPPSFFLDHPRRLYYAGVVLSVLAYLGFRAIGRTTFGLALQGVRDDPIRMASLGFNVPLHRTLAFTLAGFVAAVAGVLNVWWNGQIDPRSVSIGPTLDVLIIAVIGGISSLEGAWLGAFVWVGAENYLRDIPLVDKIGITPDRFNTVLGAMLLLIMVLSPEGLTGIIEKLTKRRGPRDAPSLPPSGGIQGSTP